jgi:hypothetical protein
MLNEVAVTVSTRATKARAHAASKFGSLRSGLFSGSQGIVQEDGTVELLSSNRSRLGVFKIVSSLRATYCRAATRHKCKCRETSCDLVTVFVGSVCEAPGSGTDDPSRDSVLSYRGHGTVKACQWSSAAFYGASSPPTSAVAISR